MSPKGKKTKDDPSGCPGFLPGDTFEAMAQGRKAQAQHSSVTKSQRQIRV